MREAPTALGGRGFYLRILIYSASADAALLQLLEGGLIVDIGLRGFLPASLVDLRRVRDLDPFIGDTITAKVIELDRQRNNVVLSRRAHLEEALAEELPRRLGLT